MSAHKTEQLIFVFICVLMLPHMFTCMCTWSRMLKMETKGWAFMVTLSAQKNGAKHSCLASLYSRHSFHLQGTIYSQL